MLPILVRKMAKKSRKIKESPYQQSITIKCYECKRGYFGDKSCGAGRFATSKTSHLGCWNGERLSGDEINATA